MKLKSLKFKSVKSTNDIAHKLIKEKKIRPTIIVSEKQTKGRGTMGKKWISKKGNLFLTIFFDINNGNISITNTQIPTMVVASNELLLESPQNNTFNSEIILSNNGYICFRINFLYKSLFIFTWRK